MPQRRSGGMSLSEAARVARRGDPLDPWVQGRADRRGLPAPPAAPRATGGPICANPASGAAA